MSPVAGPPRQHAGAWWLSQFGIIVDTGMEMKQTLLRCTAGFVAMVVAAAWSLAALGQEPARLPVFDSAQRLAWHQQHLELRATSPWRGLSWRHIGPLQMCGRVTEIAKPLQLPHTFYVATASGGIWKTENEGTTWKALFEDAPSASVGSISVDPQNPETVWAGMGESNILRSTMAGTGVYRSDDGGLTWRHLGLADTHHISRIVIHPTDSQTVYVAAGGHEYTENEERGVYKTTDGGLTWNRILFESTLAGASEIVMDPHDPETLFVALWHRIRHPWSDPAPGPGGGIYRTRDGGANWQRLTEGLPAREKSGRTGLDMTAAKPGRVFALIDNHEPAREAAEGERDSYGRQRESVIKGAELFRSDDYGDHWELVSGGDRRMQGLFSTYGWVFGQVRADPNNADTVYVLGVPLLKSTDGGNTFAGLQYADLHSDHHELWIDPANSNHLINGNDGGINLSYDGGRTWKNIENLPVVQFYNVEIDDAEPFNVYGSIQDNMSWSGPSSYRPGRSRFWEWKPVPGGEASCMEVDPNDPDTFYSESFYGSIMRSNLKTGETKRIMPRSPDDTPLRGQWVAPFILSPHNSRVVYHGMNRVFRSMNRGDSWECISPDLTAVHPERQGNISFATLTSISESPLKFGLLYAGTDDGQVHVTRDGGISWTRITSGLPDSKWVSRVAASAYDESTVYLSQNGKTDNDFQAWLWKSADCGQTWVDIASNLPGGPVNVVLEDPEHRGILYVGTDLGVYVSTDDGGKWEVLGKGLPITFVHDMKIHARTRTAVIATHGRGMFKLNVQAVKAGGSAEADEPAEEESPRRRPRPGDATDGDGR